jgi:hypothetical protein
VPLTAYMSLDNGLNSNAPSVPQQPPSQATVEAPLPVQQEVRSGQLEAAKVVSTVVGW